MQKLRFSICKISSIRMNTFRMNAIRIGMAVGVYFLLALAAGCSSDADLPPYPDGSNGDAGMDQPSEKDDEITTVPFTITLGGLSSSDANAGQGQKHPCSSSWCRILFLVGHNRRGQRICRDRQRRCRKADSFSPKSSEQWRKYCNL